MSRISWCAELAYTAVYVEEKYRPVGPTRPIYCVIVIDMPMQYVAYSG